MGKICYVYFFLFLIPLVAFAEVRVKNIDSSEFLQSSLIVSGSSIKAYRYKMPNGLTVLIVPDKRNPLATIHFMLDAGSNREQKGTTGLAHFFEHMMFRKTIGAPEGNYDRVLNSIGGSGNAGTSDSFVTFYSVFPGPGLESMLKLESDRFIHLDLADPYFSTEKGAVISERKLRVENDPVQRSTEKIRAIAERGTPTEWMTIGSKKDVEAMSIDAAQQFYQDYYTPDNTIMVIGGPFEVQSVITLVNKYFSSWQGKAVSHHTPLPADYFTRDFGKQLVCSAPIFTKRYQIVYPSAQNDQKSIVYSYIFQALLDDNVQGAFLRRLVKEKLAVNFNFYKIYWQNQSNPYIAQFNLSKDENFESALEFWQKGISEVLKKNLSPKIKKQVIKQFAVSDAETSEKMTTLVNTILENTFLLHDFSAAGRAEKIVQSATTEDFRQWVSDNLSAGHYYVTGIIPAEEGTTSCQDF